MFHVLIKILGITNFQGVKIDSDNFIYALFTAIKGVCICKVFLIYGHFFCLKCTNVHENVHVLVMTNHVLCYNFPCVNVCELQICH